MNELNLDKDLCFFDLETTGLNVVTDRILQIAIIKYPRNGGEPQELSMLINPGIPISEESMSIHGITPKDVANKPVFSQVGKKIFDFIGDADLAGYNSNRFDVPMLIEEFGRIGLEFSMERRKTIDVQRIFYKMEPRTLKAAYRFYCNSELEDAHDALNDVKATIEVFKGQIRKYNGVDLKDEDGNIIEAPVKNDMQALHEFTNDLKTLDATQRLKLDGQGRVVFNFGKYVNQTIPEVMAKEPNYVNWILEKDFSIQVKQIVRKEMKSNEKTFKK